MPLPRPAPGTLHWWVIGAVGIAIGVAGAIWFGVSATVGLPTFQTMSYKVLGDESVSVSFEVTSPDGDAVSCTVQALARDFSTVGSIDVAIPASADGQGTATERTVTLRTTSRAVTGEVKGCT